MYFNANLNKNIHTYQYQNIYLLMYQVLIINYAIISVEFVI